MFEQKRVFEGTSTSTEVGEIVNVVRRTKDYSVFNLTKFNRNVVFRKEMLEQAKQGIISPIIVNENMIVIDGQNRLLHSEKAGVEVEYVVKQGLGEADIVRMNTIQKPWSLQDYIAAFANQGRKDYIKLSELINKKYTNVTVTSLIAIDSLSNSQVRDSIKKGSFKFHNHDKAVEFLLYYERFREQTKTQKRSTAATALYELFKLEGFDKDRMISKVKATGLPEEINIKTHRHTDILKELIDAYNNMLPKTSDKNIKYHINSLGNLIIERERQTWTKGNVADEDEERC